MIHSTNGEENKIKLGYGTYGMKQLDPFAVLPELQAIGYDSIELAVAPGWTTEPHKLDAETRRKLKEQFQRCGFPAPALLDLISPCVQGADREPMLSRFRAVCELAADLRYDSDHSVVTFTLGGHQPNWDTGKADIAQSLVELADIAAGYDVILAVEPHIGGALDRPEKAEWLMEATRHPHLRLNFDMSHFAVQGLDIADCIRQCAPYAVHCHIKDGYRDNGKVRFLLPGEGEFDHVRYFGELYKIGFQPAVTVEVSGMVWNRPDYDPFAAARLSYRTLKEASETALKQLK
ncbi:MAG: ulaE 1 [Paenibacillus sp.]|jgi:inosose dehydratase|nr:ulaE 1 [Paenibacillus sp.]